MSPTCGDASKDRLFAAWLDLAFAILFTLAIVAELQDKSVMPTVVGIPTFFVYFFLSELVFGASPGKLVFGLRVVRSDGRRRAWWQILVRTLLRLVEVNPVLLGGLPAGIVILVTRRRQRIGDVLAGTLVISPGKYA